MKKKILGRPIKIKKVLKVQELRKKGLSFRDIAKLENADVKTVYRWYNYDVGKIVDNALDSVGVKI